LLAYNKVEQLKPDAAGGVGDTVKSVEWSSHMHMKVQGSGELDKRHEPSKRIALEI